MASPIVLLKDFANAQGGPRPYVNYAADLDADMEAIEAKINQLAEELRATGGANAPLVLDLLRADTLSISSGIVGAESFAPVTFAMANTQIQIPAGVALSASAGRIANPIATTLTGSGSAGTRYVCLRADSSITLETTLAQGALDLYSVPWTGSAFTPGSLLYLAQILVDGDDLQLCRTVSSSSGAGLPARTYQRIASRLASLQQLLEGADLGVEGETLGRIAIGGEVSLPGIVLGNGTVYEPTTGLYRVSANVLGIAVEELELAQFRLNDDDVPEAYFSRAVIDDLVAPGVGTWTSLPDAVKTGDYTVDADDAGTALIHSSGSDHDFTLPAVDDVPVGFLFVVRNLGAGLLTVSPDGAELINGAAAMDLAAGENAIVWSTGAEWRAFVASASAGAIAAGDVSYDNATSGLTATDVQAAIDEVAAAIPADASELTYDPSGSGLTATDVQAAIDEVFAAIPADASELSYDPSGSGLAATDVQAAIDEVFAAIPADASLLSYDPTGSGLTATDVQAAIDEVAAAIGGGGGDAASVSYDNSTSGLAATDVQAAIDEIALDPDRLEDLPESVKTSGYTLVAGDAGSAVIANSASAITFALTAAATLGAGWTALVRNIGAGALTIDPNSTEQINGATTVVLATGDAALLWCNGTTFRALIATAGKWTAQRESVKTGAYTVIASDVGSTIVANGSSAFTLSLTAVATLGAGFVFWVRNVNAGTVTLDPNSSEQINGATTLALFTGESALVWNTGTEWRATRMADGRQTQLIESVKTGNYTVLPGDAGAAIVANASSAITFSLTAAATLGAGHVFQVRNAGTAMLVIDPNSSETINGATTLLLRPGTGAVIWCNGTAFRALIGTDTTREVLTQALDLYVRTDGSDSNTGRANSAGGAFLTWQKAIDTCYAIDQNGFDIRINVGAGTYTTGVLVTKPFTGTVIIIGDTTTPSNVLLTCTNANCIQVSGATSKLTVRGFKPSTVSSGGLIVAELGAVINIDANMHYGAAAGGGGHLVCQYGGQIFASAGYTIAGGGAFHMNGAFGAFLFVAGLSITLTGTPTFSSFFCGADHCSTIQANANTYTGSANGPRYAASTNGAIETFGGGANAFPGSSAGSVATGGLYG
jgi:hypothetical protein